MTDRKDKTSQLIMKHLDGTLSEEEQTEFNSLIATDSEARDLLYELSLQHSMLYRVGKEQRLEETFSKPAVPSMFPRLIAVAAGLIILVSLIIYVISGTEAVPGIPENGKTAEVYPEIKTAGTFNIIDGERVGRNARIETVDVTSLVLGNYCNIEASKETEFVIKGEPYAEHIYLEKGEIVCDVDRNVGTFAVESEAGTVHVTGTKFLVRVSDVKGEEMKIKEMFVRVMIGAVLIAGVAGDVPLLEGQEANTRGGRDRGGRDMARMFNSMRGGFGGGQGTMVGDGDTLFVVSGSSIAKVDMKTYKIVAKVDLNEIGKDEAEEELNKQREAWIKRFDKNDDGKISAEDGEFQGQWMSRFDKDNDSVLTAEEVPVYPRPTKAASGTAVLTVAGDDLCMLRGGTLFIFGKTDLTFKKSLEIEEKKENGDNPMMRMMQGRGGDRNRRKPAGEGDANKQKKEGAKDEHGNGAVF